jgi:N-acetylglucosaminyldiphosphoundecaprenol N-acetyl-beta-D-mannosaminyltransferase
MSRSDVENVLGYLVTTCTLDECVESILASMTISASPSWLACLNANSYVVSRDDVAFAHALRCASWLVPDGVGIVLASRLLGARIRRRITGGDLFYRLNARMNEVGGFSVFFLGSTPQNLAAIETRMRRDYPNLRVVGTYSPPYKSVYSQSELEAMTQAINEARPDVLWVGMTSPKQDLWIHANRDHLNAKFAAGIGAVFDFYTGNLKRAPRLMQSLGLEWLYRSVAEPTRLGSRNLKSNPVFLFLLAAAFAKKVLSRLRDTK